MQHWWISNTRIQGFVSYMWSFCNFGFLFHQFRLKFSIKWWFLRRGKIQFKHPAWIYLKFRVALDLVEQKYGYLLVFFAPSDLSLVSLTHFRCLPLYQQYTVIFKPLYGFCLAPTYPILLLLRTMTLNTAPISTIPE